MMTIRFILAATLALLRLQMFQLDLRVRSWLRFLLAFISHVLALAFASIFLLLPAGWPEVVMANLFSMRGAFVAVMLTTFGVAAFGLATFARKIF